AMRAVRPGMFEYQLEAEYLHEFMRHGARSPAYPSIVGGGANGCILHYNQNSEKLRDGDLVLVHPGCEHHSYGSGITRTFPVNGRFRREQQALYEVVLAAEYEAIEAVTPGNQWNAFHEAALKVLTQGLVDLGLLKGEVSELIETEA